MHAATIRFAFFGTPHLSTVILDELEEAGLVPALIVTAPDKPQGRGLTLTSPPVKQWADSRGIPVMQPKKITEEVIESIRSFREDDTRLTKSRMWDVFVVAAYGKILPQAILDIPEKGTLNVHPSLLPRLRGPSPIRSAILEDERETGVSVMLLDADMDHGPVIAQKKMEIAEWPPRASAFENALAREGGALLAEVMPRWMRGELAAREQDHEKATFCKKIMKEDGRIDLSADPHKNLLKIRAFEGWPGAYTFVEKGDTRIRIAITDAHIENGALILDRVKPEGKKEMPYADFIRGLRP